MSHLRRWIPLAARSEALHTNRPNINVVEKICFLEKVTIRLTKPNSIKLKPFSQDRDIQTEDKYFLLTFLLSSISVILF